MEEHQYPEPAPQAEPPSPALGYRSAGVIAVIALCVGLFGYSIHERSQVARVSAQNQQVSAALSETRGQIGELTAKLNDLTAAEQAREQRIAEERAAAAHRSHVAVRHRRDDPRWKKFQSELEAHQQAIDATRNDLAQAKTDLSNSIARNHDELVVLQRKGERNYYEFDINKSKQYQATGPVGIKLRKANTKHQYADLQLMVDDTQLDKKHVDLFEPVTFFDGDTGEPVQLVINRITKNHIHGYVAEPKYKASELAASNTTSNGANSPASAPPVRKRLSIPND